MKKRSANPIWDLLKKLKLEPTPEKNLAIDRWEPNPSRRGSGTSATVQGERNLGRSKSDV